MPRFRLSVGLIVLLGASCAVLAGETAVEPLPDTPVTVLWLMPRLGEADPQVRQAAAARLIQLGETARPYLRSAVPLASVQMRAEIDHVLLHIAWNKPGTEPEEVAQALAGYADKDPESRCAVIDGSMTPLGASAVPALLRIVLSDPSPAVRWSAADAIRKLTDLNEDISRRVLDALEDKEGTSYQPARDNPALLALAGWVLRYRDPLRCRDLMTQSFELEIAYPSAFRSQCDFAFDWLADRFARQRNYPAALRLLREQAARSEWNGDAVPLPVARLFALHADAGPLPGIGADLRSYHEYLVRPEFVYALGRMLDQHNHRLLAGCVNSVALGLNGWSAESHYATGLFLAQLRWDAAAEREMRWCISLSSGKNYLAYFVLSELASQSDQDLQCAQNLESGLRQMHAQGLMLQGVFADEQEAQVHWHYLRAYRQLKDQVRADEHLAKLLDMDRDKQILQREPGMAADIVPALQESNRNDDADRIFDTAANLLLAKVKAAPSDAMTNNNLAWLFACSGKRLNEAVKYADRAVALDPEDAACLDTQADCYFRVGRAKEALEIETRALSFKPGDAYMARQVEKFKTAAAK